MSNTPQSFSPIVCRHRDERDADESEHDYMLDDWRGRINARRTIDEYWADYEFHGDGEENLSNKTHKGITNE